MLLKYFLFFFLLISNVHSHPLNDLFKNTQALKRLLYITGLPTATLFALAFMVKRFMHRYPKSYKKSVLDGNPNKKFSEKPSVKKFIDNGNKLLENESNTIPPSVISDIQSEVLEKISDRGFTKTYLENNQSSQSVAENFDKNEMKKLSSKKLTRSASENFSNIPLKKDNKNDNLNALNLISFSSQSKDDKPVLFLDYTINTLSKNEVSALEEDKNNAKKKEFIESLSNIKKSFSDYAESSLQYLLEKFDNTDKNRIVEKVVPLRKHDYLLSEAKSFKGEKLENYLQWENKILDMANNIVPVLLDAIPVLLKKLQTKDDWFDRSSSDRSEDDLQKILKEFHARIAGGFYEKIIKLLEEYDNKIIAKDTIKQQVLNDEQYKIYIEGIKKIEKDLKDFENFENNKTTKLQKSSQMAGDILEKCKNIQPILKNFNSFSHYPEKLVNYYFKESDPLLANIKDHFIYMEITSEEPIVKTRLEIPSLDEELHKDFVYDFIKLYDCIESLKESAQAAIDGKTYFSFLNNRNVLYEILKNSNPSHGDDNANDFLCNIDKRIPQFSFLVHFFVSLLPSAIYCTTNKMLHCSNAVEACMLDSQFVEKWNSSGKKYYFCQPFLLKENIFYLNETFMESLLSINKRINSEWYEKILYTYAMFFLKTMEEKKEKYILRKSFHPMVSLSSEKPNIFEEWARQRPDGLRKLYSYIKIIEDLAYTSSCSYDDAYSLVSNSTWESIGEQYEVILKDLGEVFGCITTYKKPEYGSKKFANKKYCYAKK